MLRADNAEELHAAYNKLLYKSGELIRYHDGIGKLRTGKLLKVETSGRIATAQYSSESPVYP